jgi:type IV secretory pathway VirB4 component
MMLPPILSHTVKENDDVFWVTMNGVLGVTYEIEPFDVEAGEQYAFAAAINRFLAVLSPRIKVRFESKAVLSKDEILDNARTDVFSKLGYTKSRHFLSFEMHIAKSLNPFKMKRLFDQNHDTEIEFLRTEISKTNISKLFNASSATQQEIDASFNDHAQPLGVGADFLTNATQVFSVIRLKSQADHELYLSAVADLKAQVGADFELVATFQGEEATRAEFKLRNEQEQSKRSDDIEAGEREIALREALVDLTGGETAAIRLEFVVILYARDTGALRQKNREAIGAMRELGQSYVETFGLLKSFITSRRGSDSLVTLRESSKGAAFYLPVNSYFTAKQPVTKNSLLLHRRSYEAEPFSLFKKGVLCANTLIIGKSGVGKSYFIGLLTKCLFNDPNVIIYKIDVGSSYVKECNRLGGDRYAIALDRPSGINPFEVLKRASHSEDIAHTVAAFLESLLLDHGETILPKEVRTDLSKAVLQYSLSRPSEPSITDFFNSASCIPRKKFLERWIEGGMFQNVFKPVKERNENSRYRYYDFETLSQASDSELIRGVVAGVMAQYNSEVIIAGRYGPRIVLFIEETKFIFKECSPFAHITAANARKFGHGIILINQESAGFYTRGIDGEFSEALFNNASHHFLFSTDGEPETYMRRHGLTEVQFEMIKTLEMKKGHYSDVLHKDETGTRIYRIHTDPEEYWHLSTDKEDWARLDALMRNVKGLKTEEAIKCLASKHFSIW